MMTSCREKPHAASRATPVGMMTDNDGKTAFVALGRADYIAFVDTATREIRDYVLVGSHPWGIVLSADEKTLFVVRAEPQGNQDGAGWSRAALGSSR
jgi:YVTN family beta-propeller protein